MASRWWWLLLCWPLLAWAGETQRLALEGRWWVAEETAPVTDVARLTQYPFAWQPSHRQAPNLGFQQAPFWFRFDLAADELAPGRWRLWVRNSLLSDVQFYLLEDGELKSMRRDGLWRQAAERASPFRYPAFILPVDAGHRYQIYLRVQSETALQVPAELLAESAFIGAKEQDDLMLGTFLGALLAMMLYNLVLFALVRDPQFLLYTGHVAALLFFNLSWQGIGPTYLWPDLMGFQSNSIATATFLVIGFSSGFCCAFLPLRDSGYRPYRLFLAVRNLAFAGALITPLLPPLWAVIASSFLSLPAVLLVIHAIASRASWQQRSDRLFALGWGLYVTGALMMGMNKFGLIEVSRTSENLLLWASVFDMALLCIALGDRFHSRRLLQVQHQQALLADAGTELETLRQRQLREKNGDIALQHAVAGQTEYSRQLGQQALECRRELAQLHQELQCISETDDLTGLKNRRHLLDRLQEEISRSQQNGARFCLLLLDIDHFRQINRHYGQSVGDECLYQTADLLQQQLKRPADLLCRLVNAQFCALLPDTALAGALQLAEGLRQHVAGCPLLCAGRRVMVTVSLGVVEQDASGSVSAEAVLERARLALQQAKDNGHNCVMNG